MGVIAARRQPAAHASWESPARTRFGRCRGRRLPAARGNGERYGYWSGLTTRSGPRPRRAPSASA